MPAFLGSKAVRSWGAWAALQVHGEKEPESLWWIAIHINNKRKQPRGTFLPSLKHAKSDQGYRGLGSEAFV